MATPNPPRLATWFSERPLTAKVQHLYKAVRGQGTVYSPLSKSV